MTNSKNKLTGKVQGVRRGAVRGFAFFTLCLALLCPSCGRGKVSDTGEELPPEERDLAAEIGRLSAAEDRGPAAGPGDGSLRRILDRAGLPEAMARRIATAAAEDPAFILDLMNCLGGDPYLRILVDKQHALPADYEPEDLVSLKDGSYKVSRGDLRLRRAAAAALEEMAAAARAGGVILVVSSSYRSYEYQTVVYNRNVSELGRDAADRESSRPGHSQHQLGLVADFGSITDAFAETAEGRWLRDNAGRFGWSLSFPDGYEAVTGYRWESWHYRYVGRDLAAFIDAWFGGIQQYALQFIYAWEEAGKNGTAG
ncbi:MAG: M15 family metallopeptidase [Treponema sp.]|nr:M15 family metallopeptidase [Treponema sp.]